MIERQDFPTYIYLHSDLIITKFNPDVDDIKDYKGNKNVYLKLDEDITAYYEITEEQHFEYEKQKEEAIYPKNSIAKNKRNHS